MLAANNINLLQLLCVSVKVLYRILFDENMYLTNMQLIFQLIFVYNVTVSSEFICYSM